jgi:hypothetical protein
MASILNLVRPEAAFDPETIAVLSAALDEAWDRLLQWEASAPGPPMRALCARWWRGGLSIWRNGASGIKKSLPTARFDFLLRTIDMSATAGNVLREQLSRRPRFPRLLLQTAESNIAWSTGSVVPQREYRPPHMALG